MENSKIKKLWKYGLIGIITGLCNGLFGSGGGIIAVPCMEKFLKVEKHKAHASAISIILPLTIISVYYYIKNDYLIWGLAVYVSIGGSIGGYIGARLLKNIPTDILRKIFGVFMLMAAIRMVF